MNDTTTRCPHCGAEKRESPSEVGDFFECESFQTWESTRRELGFLNNRTKLCREREARQKLEAEVERLRELLEIQIHSETGKQLWRELIQENCKYRIFVNGIKTMIEGGGKITNEDFRKRFILIFHNLKNK